MIKMSYFMLKRLKSQSSCNIITLCILKGRLHMSNFTIISNTFCDLTAELRKRFGVEDYARGVIYYPDGHDELGTLDWEQMTPEEYYNSMKSKKTLYKTAAVPVGELTEVFERHVSKGEDILYITLSSALSSTYSEACTVAENLMKKYEGRKILCIDSKRYSTSLGLIVVMASMKRAEGATLEETFEYIENAKHTVHQMGPMDDLFFLCKTGRISNFKAFFGSLVGVNPLADFNRAGLSEVITKAKGKSAAFELTLGYIEKTIVNPEEQIIFVAHSNREKYALQLAEKIREKFNPKEVIVNPVGMSCGASIGPGLCAAFYQGVPISEDYSKEKAIMAELQEALKNTK